MIEQLIKKDCETGEYENMSPITVFSAVKDPRTNKTLDESLDSVNHIYLPFKGNSKVQTRRQVPNYLRRKGLWITYMSCKGETITEYYNNTDYSDEAWGKADNWTPYSLNKDAILAIVDEILSWYKYK